MKKTTKLVMLFIMLVTISGLLFYYVYHATLPLEEVLSKASDETIDVLQVDAIPEQIVALLLVNQSELSIVRLHRNPLSQFVVDEVFTEEDNQVAALHNTDEMNSDALQVLIAMIEDRYYVASQIQNSQVNSVYLMFAREQIPSGFTGVGKHIDDACFELSCSKKIQIQIPLSWYSFDVTTLHSLVVFGVDENGKIVNAFAAK